ncbi:LysR family transcriptional regulator [Corynebacterium deserti]|uniref:LysR family transcriptional regulator n=1 Tax=Corynebacterium deserti TaxID=1408191 RepID=UPI0038B31222
MKIAQPPLSRQIQRLEKIVGTALLNRDNREVEPTTAGQAFLIDARSILTSTDKPTQRARLASAGVWGQLNIGYIAAAGFSLLGPTLTAVDEHMPEVSVDLFEMVTSEQLSALESGHIDVGFGRLNSLLKGFESVTVQSESMIFAAPTGHKLLDPSLKLHREDISGVPFLQHSPTKAKYPYDLCVRNFVIQESQVRYSLSQITTMVSLVAAGLGVALVPESTKNLRHEGVEFTKI